MSACRFSVRDSGPSLLEKRGGVGWGDTANTWEYTAADVAEVSKTTLWKLTCVLIIT